MATVQSLMSYLHADAGLMSSQVSEVVACKIGNEFARGAILSRCLPVSPHRAPFLADSSSA